MKTIQTDTEMVNNEFSYCITNIQNNISNAIRVIDAALDDFWSDVSELEGAPQMSDDRTKQSRSTCSTLYRNEHIFSYSNIETSFHGLMDAKIDDFCSKAAQLEDTSQASDALTKTPPHTCLALYNNEYMNIHAQYGRNFGAILIQAILRTRQ